MTAFSGGSISEESFAISTAILAAPKAAPQTDSLDDPGSLGVGSVGSRDGEATERAMLLVEAVCALRSLVWGWNVAGPRLMYSTVGGAGVHGGLSVGVFVGESNFRMRRRMVEVKTRGVRCPSVLAHSAHDKLQYDLRSGSERLSADRHYLKRSLTFRLQPLPQLSP
jgi:hypothetical protein